MDKFVRWGAERGIIQQSPDKNAFVKNIVSELGEFIDDQSKFGEVDAICDIIVFCATELPKYSINPTLALKETFKEISSRTGAWSEEEGKWLKYRTPEAKALWYTADYSKCYYEPSSDIEVPRDIKAELEDIRQDLLNEQYGKLDE